MLLSSIKKRLALYEQEKLTRIRQAITHQESSYLHHNGVSFCDFSSNDYLGLRKHPKILESFVQSAHEYGIGSGASALVSGYHEMHQATEKKFAQWLGFERCILLNSGYAANIGLFKALVSRRGTIYSDKLCHASILDGIQLSHARHQRYRHTDISHLKTLVNQNPPDLIATEGVFSMDGTLAPLTEIVEVANKCNALVMVDDAHGIGILGHSGRGIIEHLQLTSKNGLTLVLPLGKAFNAMGAIVAGSNEVIESILQFSNSYRYTTALPIPLCSAIQTAQSILEEETWRRDQLMSNIRLFIRYAKEKKLPLHNETLTPIKPIIIKDIDKLATLKNLLEENGFFIPKIRPPTVPYNTSRFRISINCLHHSNDIERLVDCLAKGMQQCQLLSL